MVDSECLAPHVIPVGVQRGFSLLWSRGEPAVGPGGTCGAARVQVTTPGFPPELAVRILVAFDRQESAMKVFLHFFPSTHARTPAGTHVLAHACMHARMQHEATCIALSFCRSCPVPARSARHVLRLLLHPPGGAVVRQQSDCQVLASAATLCCGRCECTRLWRVDHGRLLLCRRQWTSEVSWVCQADREPCTIHELGFSGQWLWCPR